MNGIYQVPIDDNKYRKVIDEYDSCSDEEARARISPNNDENRDADNKNLKVGKHCNGKVFTL